MILTFAAYKSFLGRCNPAEFQDESPSMPGLRIEKASDTKVRTYYAPFDYTNRGAQLVIVGITPGRTQMNKANRAACMAIQAGRSDEEVLLSAKKSASFGGEMRETLVALLNQGLIHERLGIASCQSLWEHDNGLVHFTSVLRNPVFSLDGTNETNYSGSVPALATYKGFADQRENFRAELLAINANALILPLGAKVAKAIQALVSGGAIPLSRVLNANGKVAEFAHPSGQNAETVNLALTNTPMAKDEYCQWMLDKYVCKKRSEGKVVTEVDRKNYLNKRATYWMRDQHTRRALGALGAGV